MSTIKGLFISSLLVMTVVLAPSITQGGGRMPPNWRAGHLIRNSDLVAVLDGPSLEIVFPRVTAPEVFGRDGPASIYRFLLLEALHGDADVGAEVTVVLPPTSRQGHAGVLHGDSLMFLKKLDQSDVDQLRHNMPDWADSLPVDVWIVTEQQDQWMSWIQLKTIKPDGEIDELPRSILVAQLTRFAGVAQEREAILAYVEELVTLRQAVLAGAELPDEENLDRFQKDVVQGAVKELQESQE